MQAHCEVMCSVALSCPINTALLSTLDAFSSYHLSSLLCSNPWALGSGGVIELPHLELSSPQSLLVDQLWVSDLITR